MALYLTLARCFDNVLQPSMIDFPPWWQVPTGLGPVLASTMHLVDALARMQLTASGQPAAIRVSVVSRVWACVSSHYERDI